MVVAVVDGDDDDDDGGGGFACHFFSVVIMPAHQTGIQTTRVGLTYHAPDLAISLNKQARWRITPNSLASNQKTTSDSSITCNVQCSVFIKVNVKLIIIINIYVYQKKRYLIYLREGS